jgi:hypothetical protein
MEEQPAREVTPSISAISITRIFKLLLEFQVVAEVQLYTDEDRKGLRKSEAYIHVYLVICTAPAQSYENKE